MEGVPNDCAHHLQRMRELNAAGSSKISASTVAKKLGIGETTVLGMYLYGSRLWGTANEQSDYDFLIVLKSADKACQTIHKGNIDALCFSEVEFKRRLQAHAFLCVLCICWLPEEWVWKRYSMKFDSLDIAAMKTSIQAEAERDWATAAKRRAKGLKDAANKIEMHAIRLLRIGQQLEQGPMKCPDFACAVDVWKTIKEDYSGTLAEPYLAGLKKEFE